MTIQWVDPIGSPTVVSSGSLPPGISVPAPVIYSGTIAATAKLDSTHSQLTALASQLMERFGDPVSYGYTPSAKDAAAMAVPPATIAEGTADTPAVMRWDFGSTSQTRSYLAALKASGLFTSLKVWASSGLTDIHHQGHSPGKDVQNGDHGEEEAPSPPVVHAGVQG
jgi:hypothetical protein